MIKRIGTLLASLAVLAGTVLVVGSPAQAYSGGYSHSGGGMFLSPTDAANSVGISGRLQAWSNSTTIASPCTQALGEIEVTSADSSGTSNSDVFVGVAARTACGNSSPKLGIEAFRNGTGLGWATAGGTDFTFCSSTAVAGCAAPAWINPDNALSSNAQYEVKITYTHIGTSSEGWWVWVKGSGAIPAGKQGWLGYYRKGLWANAAAPANQGWYGASTPWRFAYGEVYDPRSPGSRCTNMGTGSMPTSSSGALIDQLGANVPGVSSDFTQYQYNEDPTLFGLVFPSTTSLRYGGPNEC